MRLTFYWVTATAAAIVLSGCASSPSAFNQATTNSMNKHSVVIEPISSTSVTQNWSLPSPIVLPPDVTSSIANTMVHHELKKHRTISHTINIPQTHYATLFDSVFKSWKGTPYLYGGTSRRGIDCSAFVQVVYRKVYNINLPRTTLQEVKLGVRVKKQNASLGDLVFFKTGPSSHHVGIYIKDNQFMESSSSKGVIISSLNNPYWRKHFWQVRKIKA